MNVMKLFKIYLTAHNIINIYMTWCNIDIPIFNYIYCVIYDF